MCWGRWPVTVALRYGDAKERHAARRNQSCQNDGVHQLIRLWSSRVCRCRHRSGLGPSKALLFNHTSLLVCIHTMDARPTPSNKDAIRARCLSQQRVVHDLGLLRPLLTELDTTSCTPHMPGVIAHARCLPPDACLVSAEYQACAYQYKITGGALTVRGTSQGLGIST